LLHPILTQHLLRTRQEELDRLRARHHGELPHKRRPRTPAPSPIGLWFERRRRNRRLQKTTAAVHQAMSVGPTPSAQQEIVALTCRP